MSPRPIFNEIEIGPREGRIFFVEAALSLAIMSFAIFAIMGLFPVALQTAREGNRETRATLIARRIVDELQSLPGTNTALLIGPSFTNPGWRLQESISQFRPSMSSPTMSRLKD